MEIVALMEQIGSSNRRFRFLLCVHQLSFTLQFLALISYTQVAPCLLTTKWTWHVVREPLHKSCIHETDLLVVLSDVCDFCSAHLWSLH